MRGAGPLHSGRADVRAGLDCSAGLSQAGAHREAIPRPPGTEEVFQAGYLAEGPAVQGPDQATRCRHGKGGKGGWGGEGKQGGNAEGSAHALSSAVAGAQNAHAQTRGGSLRARPAGVGGVEVEGAIT